MTSPSAENGQTSSTIAVPPPGAAATSPSDWLAEYPPPRSLPLDQEALRVFELAHAFGLVVERPDAPAITFSTLVAALLKGKDETSQWFARLALENGPNPDSVFAEKGIDQATIQRLVILPSGKPAQVRVSADKHVLTQSARNVLGTAEGWAQRVGGSDIGVRHLVASYVLNPPPQHRAQMEDWNYQETKWRPAFFEWVASRYTAERWTDASQLAAPAAAAPVFEDQAVKGEALAFPGDEQTLAVLEQAATYHARRRDRWLRLQTVFHAMVETARQDTAIRPAIQPVLDAVDLTQARYQQVFEEFFGPTPEEKRHAPFTALDVSPRVLNALETARGLAVATRTNVTTKPLVGILHLAGALVSRRVDAEEVLAPMGLEVQALRRALIAHAQTHAESADVWREALGEAEDVEAGRALELNSDDPEAAVRLDAAWASDPLLIRRDVKTFAALLASKSLEPPLAIGLFGPWGSGKTTFLKRLRQEVESLAHRAETLAKPAPYVSNVVSVDFNAWHFAEAALTSSLIETILRELSKHIKDEELVAGKAWRQQKLERLETAKRNVEAAKAVEHAAQTAVSAAERTLTKKRVKAAEAATSFQSVIQGVWSATQTALQGSKVVKDSGVLDAVGGTIRSTEELRDRLTILRNRPARLLGDLGWGKSLIFAALVLAVPPLVAWLAQWILGTNQAAQALSSVTAALSVIFVWARAATGAVSKVDKAVADVAAAYAKQLAEDAGVKEAQTALDAAQASAATAVTELDAARQELARAHTEAANATLPAQMLQLASTRLDAGTYNKELTTLSLARADLEALSLILRDHRSEGASASDTAAANETAPVASDTPPVKRARNVDRVILYIDDLDRCKPADVVRVLQLVHMLLAFELFVVVVAVDARWVEECLKQSYEWLARGSEVRSRDDSGNGARPQLEMAHLSPQDYLEKIFQIAFWLEPMTVTQAADYLGSLVRSPIRESGPVVGSVPGTDPPGTMPAKVEIAGIELDYMRYLAKYVGSSPRRVKRFVNAYRLIKAGMSDTELRTFLTERNADDGGFRSGPYQLVIGLLVIGTGAPSSSAQILAELAECDPGRAMDTVVDALRGRDHPDWTMAAQVIEALMQSQKANNVSELRGWARRVRRFLLNGGQYTQVGGVNFDNRTVRTVAVSTTA